jgi:branched-chain amino acid aminotransferase
MSISPLPFFISDSKIHTTQSSACVLMPPDNHIYEVFRVLQGIPLFLEDHLLRLQLSLSQAQLQFDVEMLIEDINQLIKLNGFKEGNIKIIIWNDGFSNHSRVYYDVHSYPTQIQFENGVEVGLFECERLNPNMKMFDSVMRKQAGEIIKDENFYEVLLVNQFSKITEGSRSNVFFIQNDCLITPPTNQVLEGVTRKKVIEIIQNNKICFKENEVSIEQLSLFESVFITGTSRRVLPVRKIVNHKKTYNANHHLIRFLQNEFLSICESYIDSKKLEKE